MLRKGVKVAWKGTASLIGDLSKELFTTGDTSSQTEASARDIISPDRQNIEGNALNAAQHQQGGASDDVSQEAEASLED